MLETIVNNIEPVPTFGIGTVKFELADSGPITNKCRLKAINDWEAICDWLANHNDNAGTHRIYRREAVRLFLWCRHKRGIILARLSKDDLEAYLKFLKAPDKSWCTNRKNIRKGKWKPFVGPLGIAAYRTAAQAINSLLQYLTDASYIEFNPFKLINSNKVFIKDKERQKYKVWERILEDDEWEAVQQAIKDLPENTKEQIDNKERTKFLFTLLYLLGLRISEVTKSTWGSFKKRNNHWWFFIEGKGGKLGHIPVNSQLLNCIKGYRLYLGKDLLPTPNENEHLIISKKTNKPLGVRQLRTLVKNVGKLAASKFIDDLVKKQKLEKLSPHWLRHLSASHQDRAGVPFTIIQANHRHVSFQTTQLYIHAEDNKRYLEMEKLGLNLPQSSFLDKKEHILIINIKIRSINSSYKFEKLLQSIEKQVLREYNCQRKGDVDQKEFNYAEFSKWSKTISII